MIDQELEKRFAGMKSFFEPLAGASLLISGGTGFIGKWLLLGLDFANAEWGAGVKTTVVSRDPARFFDSFPEFKRLKNVKFVAGDIRSFEVEGSFDLMIHAATEASAKLERENPQEMLSVTVEGTRRALRIAQKTGVKRMLLTSSGGVYGEQPPGVDKIPEELDCKPFTAYGKGKLEAERLCSSQDSLACPIARCFSFVGPYLPLDSHYAAGNFLRDALAGRNIVIQGDGTPVRSYMHPSELVLWLLRILMKGENGEAFNAGSDVPVSVRELAEKILAAGGRGGKVEVLGVAGPGASSRYVPDVSKAKRRLGLSVSTDLDETLKSSVKWLEKRSA